MAASASSKALNSVVIRDVATQHQSSRLPKFTIAGPGLLEMIPAKLGRLGYKILNLGAPLKIL